MDNLLGAVINTDFRTESGCIGILGTLEEQLKGWDNNVNNGRFDSGTEDGAASLLSLLDVAMFTWSSIPEENRFRDGIVKKLEEFFAKILESIKTCVQKFSNVETYSVTMSFPPSITLTFKPLS